MSENPFQGIYREVPMRDWGWKFGRPREALLEAIQGRIIPVGRALDLCQDRSWNSLYLAQARFEVTALHRSPEDAEATRKMAEGSNLHVDAIVASWKDMEFAEGSFGFAYDMGCFGRIDVEERNDYVASVGRVLRARGFFLLLALNNRDKSGGHRFSVEDIKSIFHPRFEILKADDMMSEEEERYYTSYLMRRSD